MNIKTFSIHSVRNVFGFFIALGLGYVAYTVSPTSVTGPKVEAGASQNVSGFAWSDTIGYISFNSTSDGSATSYGVNIDTGTGAFSGNAWSSKIDTTMIPNQGGIGWISFDRAVTGNPPGSPYQTGVSTDPIAKVDTTTGNVTGWARALASCTQDALGNLSPSPCVTNPNAGGWDGWIKLAKDPADSGSTYGVKINPADGKFSGYAWGGAKVLPSGDSDPTGVSVIGWINFAGTAQDSSTYAVQGPVLTALCTSNFDCTGGKLCNISTGACVVPGQTCGPGSSCGIGQSCNGSNMCISTGGPCTSNAQCVSGQVCNLTTSTCVAPTGGSCTANVDCIGGQICNTTTNLCVNKPKTQFWQF